MSTALIGLGSNLGDRAAAIDLASNLIARIPGVHSFIRSGLHGFAPVGGPKGQMDFLNAVGLLETSLSPQELLSQLQEVERQVGRTPGPRWGPRPIDLDLLLFDLAHFVSPTLTIPHPRFAFRRFVLVPAVEVAALMLHPEIGWNLAQMLNHLMTAPPLIAVLGPQQTSIAELAKKVCSEVNGTLISISGGANESNATGQIKALLAAGKTVLTDFIPQDMPPKLIAALDVPRLAGLSLADMSDPAQKHLETLSLRCYAPQRGPTLSLSSTDMSWAAEELVAAIRAMG